jgi:hypothetical protein
MMYSAHLEVVLLLTNFLWNTLALTDEVRFMKTVQNSAC